MVVDDVEDDLDPGAVQRLDHVSKLVERAERVGSRAVAVMRRKKRERLISPIIAEAGWTVLIVKSKNRKQLDRANAEVD